MNLVAIRLGTACPECLGPVPLNRVAPGVFCHHCLSDLELRELWPDDLFARCWDRAPHTWSVGKRDQGANLLLKVRVEAEKVAAIPEGAVARPADKLVHRIFPGVVRVHGEAPGGDPSRTPSANPLAFGCLNCGARLRIDGTQRVVACEFCKESSFLPDALWLRMHPSLKRQWFVLEYP